MKKLMIKMVSVGGWVGCLCPRNRLIADGFLYCLSK